MIDNRKMIDRIQNRVTPVPVTKEEHERLCGLVERASGSCICDACGNPYFNHSVDPRLENYDGSFTTILLCDGRLVHL